MKYYVEVFLYDEEIGRQIAKINLNETGKDFNEVVENIEFEALDTFYNELKKLEL